MFFRISRRVSKAREEWDRAWLETKKALCFEICQSAQSEERNDLFAALSEAIEARDYARLKTLVATGADAGVGVVVGVVGQRQWCDGILVVVGLDSLSRQEHDLSSLS